MFALIDCNNFYVSCERVFNPGLERKPVIILSNNDGCVISRSNEAKQLNIPMGAPFHEWKEFCQKNNVHVFSSNYELYGDMSRRVMQILSMCCQTVEVYSIDEAFVSLASLARTEFQPYMQEIRQRVRAWTGLPVSIGIAPTKTLAKMANHIAKKMKGEDVFDMSSKRQQMIVSELFPIQQIWGIGKNLARKLNELDIHTAQDLQQADQKRMRIYFGVVIEKIMQELRGISCLPMEMVQAKKQIMASRSFGKPVYELAELEEAVSYYADIACVKLRKQQHVASGVYVYVHTNHANPKQAQYTNGVLIPFATPSADTRYIIQMAKKGLQQIYCKGYKFKKAGVILTDLAPASIKQYDMLDNTQPTGAELMKTVDAINQRYGKKTMFYCAEGVSRPWQLKCEHRSPRYTTRWEELAGVGY